MGLLAFLARRGLAEVGHEAPIGFALDLLPVLDSILLPFFLLVAQCFNALSLGQLLVALLVSELLLLFEVVCPLGFVARIFHLRVLRECKGDFLSGLRRLVGERLLVAFGALDALLDAEVHSVQALLQAKVLLRICPCEDRPATSVRHLSCSLFASL